MSENLNLTFGSAGFTFAEPGNYEVMAVLAIYDDVKQVDNIVKSGPLYVRIAYPKTTEDEHDALTILNRRDVGYYFALGGSDVLGEAAGNLEDIRARRQGKEQVISDPLVAYITRCQAINLAWDFVSYEANAYKRRPAEIAAASARMDQIEKPAAKLFDPATARSTQRLAATLRELLANA